jgi:hypothetical protein
MNLIIGVRSAWAAPAACRKAFVAANIFEYRSVRSGNVIDLQQMMLKLRFLGLSDKETLGAKNVQHEVTFRPRAHTRIDSVGLVEVNSKTD